MKTKRVKFNLFATIGMMVALGTVAFTAPKNEITDSIVWYEFTQQMDDNPAVPGNYTKIGASNPDCLEGNELCAIRASDNGHTPDPSELASLQSEISAGKPTGNVVFKE